MNLVAAENLNSRRGSLNMLIFGSGLHMLSFGKFFCSGPDWPWFTQPVTDALWGMEAQSWQLKHSSSSSSHRYSCLVHIFKPSCLHPCLKREVSKKNFQLEIRSMSEITATFSIASMFVACLLIRHAPFTLRPSRMGADVTIAYPLPLVMVSLHGM